MGDPQSTTLTLICAYCGASDLSTTVVDAPGGLVTAAQAAARSSPVGAQLLGESPEQQAQILEWLTYASAQLAGRVSDETLAKTSAALADRTFLAGGTAPSLADLVAYGLLHGAVAELPPAQIDSLCNLLRWFDLMQHLTADAASCNGAAATFPFVTLPLPAYVPPPPPPPPAAAAAASAASSATAVSSGKSSAPAAATDTAAQQAAKKADKSGGKKATDTAAAAAAAGSGAAAAATGVSAEDGQQQLKKKEKKEKKADSGAAAPSAKAPKEADEARIDMLDMRVGTIVSVTQHPNADALYLEEIDVGEDKPRQVISGLVRFVPIEAMRGRRVVVACNLKPAKMRDVMSYGMVMCASNDAHDRVDPVTPPEGVPNGERITFQGYESPPLEEVNPKKKILERLFPDLTTNGDGIATYKGVPFMTTAGPVTASIPNAHVS